MTRVFLITDPLIDAATQEILYLRRRLEFGGNFQLSRVSALAGKSQAKASLRLQRLVDVRNLPESLAGEGVFVDGQDLVSRFESLACRIAIGTHSSNVAMVADHLHREFVVVNVGTRRGNKKSVRIVEAIEGGGDLRHCAIERVSLVNVFLRLAHRGIPIHAMELRIVIVLLNVPGYITQHALRAVAITLGVLLRPGQNGQYADKPRHNCGMESGLLAEPKHRIFA